MNKGTSMQCTKSGRMKPCLHCGQEFYCRPCEDIDGSVPERRYCSQQCGYDVRRVTPALFWSYVHKGERCWIWTGTVHYRGYGACSKSYGDTRAHRVAWKLTNGNIPKGAYVLHRCHTPLCVNPAHLYLGDQRQNMADCIAAGRKSHRYTPVDQLLHPQLSKRLTGRQW